MNPNINTIPSALKCKRHSNVSTVLRCGKCNDLICPKCTVQSPVGARCPDCSKSTALARVVATPVDLIKAIVAALVLGIILGAGIGGIIIALTLLPIRVPLLIEIIFALGLFASGAPAGTLVRQAAGNKIDQRIRYIAAFTLLIVYAAATLSLSFFSVGTNFLIPLFGLAFGAMVALQRAR